MSKLQTSNFKFQNKSEIQISKAKKPFNLRERLLHFSRRIVEVCQAMPKGSSSEIMGLQLLKAGTAIGANFEEADSSLTKRDFIHKVSIARKEAKEARYWLILISPWDGKDLTADIKECEEIINILSAILIKSGFKRRY